MPAIPKPFSNRTVGEWISQFETANEAEDRLIALQAVASLVPMNEATHWASCGLSDSDPSVRALAAKLLGASGIALSDINEDRIVGLLGNDDPDDRFESARALIRAKSKQTTGAVRILFEFLDEPETHPLMVAAVINAICEVDSTEQFSVEEFVSRLKRFLGHERAEIREALACAFAKWPQMSISCISELLPLVDDSEPIVREKIAMTLGLAGIINESVLSALKSATQDEDSEVARVANEALQQLVNRPT